MDANKIKRAVIWCLEDLTFDNADKEYEIKCEMGAKFALLPEDVKGLQQEVLVNQLMRHPDVKAWLRRRVEGFVADAFYEADDGSDEDEVDEGGTGVCPRCHGKGCPVCENTGMTLG